MPGRAFTFPLSCAKLNETPPDGDGRLPGLPALKHEKYGEKERASHGIQILE